MENENQSTTEVVADTHTSEPQGEFLDVTAPRATTDIRDNWRFKKDNQRAVLLELMNKLGGFEKLQEDQKASGLNIKDYCERHGFGFHEYYRQRQIELTGTDQKPIRQMNWRIRQKGLNVHGDETGTNHLTRRTRPGSDWDRFCKIVDDYGGFENLQEAILRSNLTIAKWCNNRGLKVNNYQRYRKKVETGIDPKSPLGKKMVKEGTLPSVERQSSVGKEPRFNEFRATPETVAANGNGLNGHLIEVEKNGIKFRVSNENVEGLKTVLEVVTNHS